MKVYTPILSAIEEAAVEGLEKGMRAMLERARFNAPKDDRDLVRSGRVRIDDLTGQVAFTAAHAAKQHEDLDLNHPNGGEAKYLENAANEIPVEEYVADAITRSLRG